MRRFHYWRDEVFLVGCLLYAANRWALKPLVTLSFVHGYFSDLLLIPCALPLLLGLYHLLGLRADDGPPTATEILMALGVWSAVCEGLGPRVLSSATGDWRDLLAYGAGALAAGLWWHRPHCDDCGRPA